MHGTPRFDLFHQFKIWQEWLTRWTPKDPMAARITGSLLGTTLHRRHNERDGVSNHRRLDCLFDHLFRRRSKKTSKLCITGLCEGNSPVTGEFPSQRASNAENISIWCRHHENRNYWYRRGVLFHEMLSECSPVEICFNERIWERTLTPTLHSSF